MILRVVSTRTALHLRTVKMSCVQQDILPKFSTRRLSIITQVTAVLIALALLTEGEGEKLLSPAKGKPQSKCS